MSNAYFEPPIATNEPVLSYAPGTVERSELQAAYEAMKITPMDVPMYIGDQHVTTSDKVAMYAPHDLSLKLGTFNNGTQEHARQAIDAALEAKESWAAMPWQERASIFLRAADLLTGPFRARMNAATMLCQSKNAFQAEIDAVCEMADFFRFNVQYMTEVYAQQPESAPGIWNRLEYRPLEGFVFALTPFNFTSIAANLCAAPAMLGNVVVWKPADSQIYSANIIMELFEAAGLPKGVINLIYGDGPAIGDVVFNHPEFTGLHFTGSTGVFKHLWKTIGQNIDTYRSYPRVVGETGGKDFVVAHPSADAKVVATGLVRGAYEYQGQKCSAASRAYIPKSKAAAILEYVKEDLKTITVGSPDDFSHFVNAVIDEKAFDKISSYIDYAHQSKDANIEAGGTYDKSKGYFIQPTLIVTEDPKFKTMVEEIFGPVLTVYVYEDEDFEATLHLVDETSPYALTGAIFSQDKDAVALAHKILKNAAGNFYVNDKPTGAVVGQQPFGGARASGTNDKAGSILNLFRWISPRTIKENFVPPTDYRYPFLG